MKLMRLDSLLFIMKWATHNERENSRIFRTLLCTVTILSEVGLFEVSFLEAPVQKAVHTTALGSARVADARPL